MSADLVAGGVLQVLALTLDIHRAEFFFVVFDLELGRILFLEAATDLCVTMLIKPCDVSDSLVLGQSAVESCGL